MINQSVYHKPIYQIPPKMVKKDSSGRQFSKVQSVSWGDQNVCPTQCSHDAT